MITVRLNRSEFEYDIHSLIKAFYPSEDVYVYSEDEKGSKKKDISGETIRYHMDTEYQENGIGITFYEIQEAEMQEAGKHQVADTYIEVDYSDRKETKNRLKRALYQMLSGYTKQELPWGNLTGIRPTKIPMNLLEEGKNEEEIRQYMKETYFASDEKIDLSIQIAKRELELLHKLDYENGYSIYIGIPFCPSTCLYCSFTSYPLGIWKDRMDDYLTALEKEIDFTAVKFAHKKLNTIYIGGGTPTTLTAPQLDRLLRKIKCSFDLSHLVEFTVEAGRPDSITREKLEVLRKHDIDRISINPQTMKQATLDLIGRHHTVEQTVESYKLAREIGFTNINMDLIVGLPDESIDDVRDTMERLRELDPDSITVHSLAIKRAARLRMFKDDYQDYKIVNTKEHIDLTAKVSGEMGLSPYYLYRQKNMAGNFENVGYAKPGKAGVYNVLIMEEKQTIMALGAGATTKFVFDNATRMERVENVKDIKNYLERTDEMIARKIKKMEEIAWH